MRCGRYAAIDIGTVTCRMLVVDVGESGLHELTREYAITNLGEGVDATGELKPEAMERFGIASATPLKQWCRLYREGGAEALRPRPKGRPRGSGAKGAPKTREQELEERVRRPEAQVAYLKNR